LAIRHVRIGFPGCLRVWLEFILEMAFDPE